jgi:hypothetical protein
MHSAEEIWRDLAAPLPSFADLVRSYARSCAAIPSLIPTSRATKSN